MDWPPSGSTGLHHRWTEIQGWSIRLSELERRLVVAGNRRYEMTCEYTVAYAPSRGSRTGQLNAQKMHAPRGVARQNQAFVGDEGQ